MPEKKIMVCKFYKDKGKNQLANTIEEAEKIVNQLIDEQTVEITIRQKEWLEVHPEMEIKDYAPWEREKKDLQGLVNGQEMLIKDLKIEIEKKKATLENIATIFASFVTSFVTSIVLIILKSR